MSPSDGWQKFVNRLSGSSNPAEDERLMALFHNRVELKKELTALEEEKYRLLDRLKLQETATARAEEQLAELEQYLGNPGEASKCIAYFQLRAVWRGVARRIEAFSAELARQQKDRERRQQLAEFERRQHGRRDDVQRDLVDAGAQHDQLLAELKLAEQRRDGLRGFWNYFRRRALDEDIVAKRQFVARAASDLDALNARRLAIEDEPVPDFPGISVDGRRAINLAVIAAAEWLYERYASGGIADLARQSMQQRVYDTHYGTPEQCQSIIQTATRALADLERLQDDLHDIKLRTDRIKSAAVYRNEGDTVPVPESIVPPPSDGRRLAGINVLLDEFWDIYKVLVR